MATHLIVRTYLGDRHYDNRGEDFGSDRAAAERFARACGGRGRTGGVADAEVLECSCDYTPPAYSWQ